MEGQASCGFKDLCAETGPEKKEAIFVIKHVHACMLSPARDGRKCMKLKSMQERLLKENRKEKERYKVVRKERERGRKSKQMKMTGNAEHVTQASLKMRKMEINASGM